MNLHTGLGETPSYTASAEELALINAQLGTQRPDWPAAAGPTLPSGFTAKPFDCPPGSDFNASQEVGMCVAGDYTPIAVTLVGGSKAYYNLDGTLAGSAGIPTRTLIAGVPDMYLYAGIGVLVLLVVRGRRR